MDGHIVKLIRIVRKEEPFDDSGQAAIVNVLHQAGFGDVTSIAQKKAVGYDTEDGGSKTGATFSRNPSSGLVATRGKKENEQATDWLDSLWEKIIEKKDELEPDRLKAVKSWIALSVPLAPIVLTQYGERLGEDPLELRGVYTVHLRDDGSLRHSIGVHDTCNAWMDVREVSLTHNALVCRQCGLRVVIPKEVETYRQLRDHFSEFNPS